MVTALNLGYDDTTISYEGRVQLGKIKASITVQGKGNELAKKWIFVWSTTASVLTCTGADSGS
jgi:hypothetical protein